MILVVTYEDSQKIDFEPDSLVGFGEEELETAGLHLSGVESCHEVLDLPVNLSVQQAHPFEHDRVHGEALFVSHLAAS